MGKGRGRLLFETAEGNGAAWQVHRILIVVIILVLV
jgi:hypothetical protein